MKKVSRKCTGITTLLIIFLLALVGIILSLKITNKDFKICCKDNILCGIWITIATISFIKLKRIIRSLLELFEKMYLIRDEMIKHLPNIIIAILVLYIFPIPICLFVFKGRYYNSYMTLLTSILGLNGIITFFITSANAKRDSGKNSQHAYSEKADLVVTGFRIVTGVKTFGDKKFKLENKILCVADYLQNGSGDNLWNIMNSWYDTSNKNSNYPLFNARANNWNGNEEWYEQLNNFVMYLQNNHLIEIKEDKKQN